MNQAAAAYAKLLKIAERSHHRIATIVHNQGELPNSNSSSDCLVRFLANTVVGQQLSAAAAETIWVRVQELSANLGKPLVEVLTPQFEIQIQRGTR